MTSLASPWRLHSVGDESLVVEVTAPCTARELSADLLPSKAGAMRELAQGHLRRGGQALAHDERLAPKDLVELVLTEDRTRLPTSEYPVDVVWHDRLLLAADKPAGLLVHSDGTGADTLTARVAGWLARAGAPGVPQAVQRLDVETTGIVLFSLTRAFQPALDAQVAGHDMRKRYLAVVDGELPGSAGGWRELRWPVARDRHDARRMRAGGSGKPALTRVRTLETHCGRSLLLVELGSGRRHQIRVHLARAGHPILGDVLYGGPAWSDGLMLHAWQERLAHPLTSEPLDLRTAVPPRFLRLFSQANLTLRK